MDGGLAVHAEQLVAAMSGAGVEVTLLAGRPRGATAPPHDRVEYIPVPRYGSLSGRYVSFHRASRARKEALAPQNDLFHSVSSVHGHLSTRSPGHLPYVTTVHNTMRSALDTSPRGARPSALARRGFYRGMATLEKAICRAADAVIAVSASTARQVSTQYSVSPTTIHIVPNGVDPSRIRRGAPAMDPPRLLFVGRLVARKGVSDLLAAAAGLARKGVAFQVDIVGRGDSAYQASLQKMASDLSVADRVHFRGQVTDADLAGLYSQAWALVLPSRLEGFGMVAAEAMACGTPVVGYAIPGLSDVVVPGTGLLVAASETGALEEALGRILADARLRQDLSSRARAWAAQYSWPAAAQGTRAAYEAAIAAARNHR